MMFYHQIVDADGVVVTILTYWLRHHLKCEAVMANPT